MPNYCGYEMKVVGKKSDRDKFLDALTNYDLRYHCYRIFEAEIYDEGEDYYKIGGYCAWSIQSCCRRIGYYQDDYHDGADPLAELTSNLNLKLEVFSEEDGCCFQEHYVYDNGECLTDECVEWMAYYVDAYKNVEELNNDCQTDFTEEEWKEAMNDSGRIEVGGFGDDYLNWTI